MSRFGLWYRLRFERGKFKKSGGGTETPPDGENPPPDPVPQNDILLSSSDELDPPSRLLLSGTAQTTGTDALAF